MEAFLDEIGYKKEEFNESCMSKEDFFNSYKEELTETHLQFILDNMELLEDNPMLGVSRNNARENSTKYIHYKGNFISIDYDAEKGVWKPGIGFRSIIDALKFSKFLVDLYAKK